MIFYIYFVRSDRGRRFIDFVLTCWVFLLFRVQRMAFDLIDWCPRYVIKGKLIYGTRTARSPSSFRTKKWWKCPISLMPRSQCSCVIGFLVWRTMKLTRSFLRFLIPLHRSSASFFEVMYYYRYKCLEIWLIVRFLACTRVGLDVRKRLWKLGDHRAENSKPVRKRNWPTAGE
jgi:hypothetical protein